MKRVKKYLPRFVSALLGAGIGLGVGMGLGAIADRGCHGCDDPGLGRASGGILGLPLGATLGAAMKIKGPTVYEAP